jgi:hypothetical protein
MLVLPQWTHASDNGSGKSLEFAPRDGLPNFFRKLDAGEDVTIAYLGGSITGQNGWRVLSQKWFEEEYPDATIDGLNAAIGGTGSDLGVFRVENDAVADHYGIPSIHMGYAIALMEKEGTLVMKTNAPMSNVAGEELNESAELATDKNGRIIFSKDGVHPYLETGHGLYTDALVRSFKKIQDKTGTLIDLINIIPSHHVTIDHGKPAPPEGAGKIFLGPPGEREAKPIPECRHGGGRLLFHETPLVPNRSIEIAFLGLTPVLAVDHGHQKPQGMEDHPAVVLDQADKAEQGALQVKRLAVVLAGAAVAPVVPWDVFANIILGPPGHGPLRPGPKHRPVFPPIGQTGTPPDHLKILTRKNDSPFEGRLPPRFHRQKKTLP